MGITGVGDLTVGNCADGEIAMQTRASVLICTTMRSLPAPVPRDQTAVAIDGEGEEETSYSQRKDACRAAFAIVARHPVETR